MLQCIIAEIIRYWCLYSVVKLDQLFFEKSNHASQSVRSPKPFCQCDKRCPSGVCLGTGIILIYVNHVVADLNCKYKIFADDIKLYLSFDVDESNIGVDAGQSNIDILVDASTSWGLVMNISKCVCMRFSPRSSILTVSGTSPYKIGNQPIKFVQSHSDLGITIDRTLKFHSHIRTKVNIASAMTNNILSCTLVREPEFIMNIIYLDIGMGNLT